MNSEIKNAVITDVRFDTERGLSAWVMLDYGGSGQGFGGHMLYAPKGWAAHNCGGDLTGHFIYRVLEIAEAEDWSRLKGKTVRARIEGGFVEALGHIIKDDWFCPRSEFDELLAKFKGTKDAARP